MVRNEENNLSELLPNLKGVVDEFVVIDHDSSDGTLAVLEKYGARVIRRPNPRLGNCASTERLLLGESASYSWILHIDADERLAEETRKELRKFIPQKDYDVIWLLSRHFYAPGKWYKHGFYAPHREPRLYRKSCEADWNIKIHETAQIKGRHFYSDLPYDHICYVRSKEMWRKKHEEYIKVEHRQKKHYLSGNPPVEWFFVIAGYPVYFIYGMFFKLAFLDGVRGVINNHFLALYFARSRYLELFLKKKLGMVEYVPTIDG
jgi:glycosyltransferase involved in cell wall biosynthesis